MHVDKRPQGKQEAADTPSLSEAAHRAGTIFDLRDMKIGCLHGTSSGSLVDLLQDGLIPTGTLPRVSFTGEMMGGILPHCLNSTAISVVAIDGIELAASYAHKNLAGWDPFRSQQLMELAEQWMREGGTPEAVIEEWRPIRKAIEDARKARWETLTPEERNLIRSPFPIICGVAHEVPTFPTNTSVPGELAIRLAKPQQLDLFIPEAHLVTALYFKDK